MISIVLQCDCIAYDELSCAIHWDCIAYDKLSCAIHRLWISIVVQCIGFALLIIDSYTMLRNEIAHDELSCEMHWECTAYDKHSCAMHWAMHWN